MAVLAVARVPLLDEDDLDPADRDVLERPINLYRAAAHAPELARRYRELGRWFRYEGALDPRLRELAVLQVGFVAASPYEWSHHVHLGEQFGVSEEDVEAVVRESRGETSALGPLERAALELARTLTLEGRVPDELWARLAAQLDHSELVELCGVVAFYNMTVRLLAALEVDVEESYREPLERFPLG